MDGLKKLMCVAATIKHFFANNRINACGEYWGIMSERTAREIYLRGFEIAMSCHFQLCLES